MAKLSEHEIGQIKGMLARGDQQMDIATYFNTNVGRISEINTGFRPAWRKVEAVHHELPPPGPYKLVERDAVIVREGEKVISAAEYDLVKELLADLAEVTSKYQPILDMQTEEGTRDERSLH